MSVKIDYNDKLWYNYQKCGYGERRGICKENDTASIVGKIWQPDRIEAVLKGVSKEKNQLTNEQNLRSKERKDGCVSGNTPVAKDQVRILQRITTI